MVDCIVHKGVQSDVPSGGSTSRCQRWRGQLQTPLNFCVQPEPVIDISLPCDAGSGLWCSLTACGVWCKFGNQFFLCMGL